MMATTTARANLVVLNRGADLFFFGENVAAPLGHYSARDLPAALDALGADAVTVQYRTVTDPKERARDRAKYDRRLADLGAGWARGDWAEQVIDGYVQPDTITCTLTRAAR